MSEYKYQAKATKEFGVTFRSKLEATWAYAIKELKEVEWDYVDSDWHDFVIHAPWGDARVEVKPVGSGFWKEAVKRIPDKETLFIVQGEPAGERLDWSIETQCPVSCIYRTSESISTVAWSCFDIAMLEAMWHGARSWPIRSALCLNIFELDAIEKNKEAMLAALNAASPLGKLEAMIGRN